ncbi:hypothetical protein RHS03_01641, partial [Rhizoctonia solani]
MYYYHGTTRSFEQAPPQAPAFDPSHGVHPYGSDVDQSVTFTSPSYTVSPASVAVLANHPVQASWSTPMQQYSGMDYNGLTAELLSAHPTTNEGSNQAPYAISNELTGQNPQEKPVHLQRDQNSNSWEHFSPLSYGVGNEQWLTMNQHPLVQPESYAQPSATGESFQAPGATYSLPDVNRQALVADESANHTIINRDRPHPQALINVPFPPGMIPHQMLPGQSKGRRRRRRHAHIKKPYSHHTEYKAGLNSTHPEFTGILNDKESDGTRISASTNDDANSPDIHRPDPDKGIGQPQFTWSETSQEKFKLDCESSGGDYDQALDRMAFGCKYFSPKLGRGCWSTDSIQDLSWLLNITQGEHDGKGFFPRDDAEWFRHLAMHRYNEWVESGYNWSSMGNKASEWNEAKIDQQIIKDIMEPTSQKRYPSEESNRPSVEVMMEWLKASKAPNKYSQYLTYQRETQAYREFV